MRDCVRLGLWWTKFAAFLSGPLALPGKFIENKTLFGFVPQNGEFWLVANVVLEYLTAIVFKIISSIKIRSSDLCSQAACLTKRTFAGHLIRGFK
jgi:hypothetical protein